MLVNVDFLVHGIFLLLIMHAFMIVLKLTNWPICFGLSPEKAKSRCSLTSNPHSRNKSNWPRCYYLPLEVKCFWNENLQSWIELGDTWISITHPQWNGNRFDDLNINTLWIYFWWFRLIIKLYLYYNRCWQTIK